MKQQQQQRNGEPFASPEERGWSALPADILRLILLRLGPVDHLRLGGVCQQWRHVRAACHAAGAPPRRQLPCLMLFSRGQPPVFLSPSDGGRFTIRSRRLEKATLLASCGSWLAMRDRDGTYLFNPFTLKRHALPRLHSSAPKLAVSSPPGSSAFSAVATNNFYASFLHMRHGDTEWHASVHGDYEWFSAPVAVGRKFYALTRAGWLIDMDLDRDPVAEIVFDAGKVTPRRYYQHVYLVESEGELLAVLIPCATGDPPFSYQPEVSALVRRFDAAASAWVNEEAGIGGRLLFLGLDYCCSVAASEYGLAGDMIYTAGSRTYGVYDLLTRSGTVCCPCDGAGVQPAWVVPDHFYRDGRVPEERVRGPLGIKFFILFSIILLFFFLIIILGSLVYFFHLLA